MAEMKELTDEELEEQHKKLTQSYKPVITDKTKRLQLKTFQAYLKTKASTAPEKEQKHVAQLLHEVIVRQVRSYAMLQFLIMEKSNDYGAMGEQRVSISFCRNILKISASQEVTQEDADNFRKLIDDFDKKVNISSLTKLKEKSKQFVIEFLGERLDFSKGAYLNELLGFIGIPYRLSVSTFKGYQAFVYGQMEEKAILGKSISIMGKEIVRSPWYVLSIAAGQGDVGTWIRREACETIFYNKWAGFFDSSAHERLISRAHAYSAIREGLKERALKYYKASSRADIEKIKDLFVQEMIEGIFYHEVGHEIGEHKAEIPPELLMLGRSHGVMGDDIILVLKEAIADWAPEEAKLSGPVWAFLQKAKKDPDVANRLFYVYLSDNWFIDSNEEFMSIQTDLLTALLLPYIRKDGSFDFEQLENGFQATVALINKVYIEILAKIRQFLDEGTYTAGIHRINLQTLEKELHKVYQKDIPAITLDELRTKINYWVHLFGLIKSFSPEVHNKIEEWIKESGDRVRLIVLEHVSKGQVQAYNSSIREYILARMEEIGIYKRAQAPQIADTISFLCRDLKIPPTLQEKVKKRFTAIMDDESLDIAISYEGKPDPFWAVFQEILLRSGYGNIRSGMGAGEGIKATDTPNEKKKKAQEALESFRDQIESEMYLEIKLLRVNSLYLDQAAFDPLLDQVKFYDGSGLRQKLNSIQFIEIKNDRLMEAYIPLKRGYIEWNTSQAIWRINQELRPDDYLKQWTIDKEFLTALFEAYTASA